MAILRGRLTVPMLATSAQLARLPSGCEVAVAGLVIARQRPSTAHGTMFLLFEDEFGTINLIVPRAVYEGHRQLARTEPLLLARGSLERHRVPVPFRRAQAEEEVRPVINVIVRELEPLERFLSEPVDAEEHRDGSRVHRLRSAGSAQAGSEEEPEGADVGSSMRAAAPPMQSFAGRRR
jgi:DNA polymerase III alpha subunit